MRPVRQTATSSKRGEIIEFALAEGSVRSADLITLVGGHDEHRRGAGDRRTGHRQRACQLQVSKTEPRVQQLCNTDQKTPKNWQQPRKSVDGWSLIYKVGVGIGLNFEVRNLSGWRIRGYR